MQKDPHEMQNVYSDPQYANTVDVMKNELENLRKKYKVPSNTLPDEKE